MLVARWSDLKKLSAGNKDRHLPGWHSVYIDFLRYVFGLNCEMGSEMRTPASALLLLLLCFQPFLAKGQDNVTIPTDYFSGITLDEAVVGPFFSYKAIHFSGTVFDPWVSQVIFTFKYNEDEDVNVCGSFKSYEVSVRNQEFSHTFFFSNEEADDYLLQLSTRTGTGQYAPAGVFRPITIRENAKTAPIPVGFFPDIELDSPIPVEITTGQAVRVSGTVFDPSLTMVALQFNHKGIGGWRWYKAPIIDGRFSKVIFFAHKTADIYDFQLVRFQGNRQVYASGDVFRSINVIRGEGTAVLPFDYFEEINLTSPMPVMYGRGQRVRVTGTVTDPSVHRIQLKFWMPIAGQTYRAPVDFTAPVTNGEFSVNIEFTTDQHPGDGFLYVYLWRRGKRSRGPREFKPITVIASYYPDFDGDGTVGFVDFFAFADAFGTSSDDVSFDPRFDLDGDGEVGFSDFVIFSRYFGKTIGS